MRTPGTASDVGLTLPTGLVARLRPEDLARDGVASTADVPLNQDAAYVRELLELATRDDLLGPANGPKESRYPANLSYPPIFARGDVKE